MNKYWIWGASVTVFNLLNDSALASSQGLVELGPLDWIPIFLGRLHPLFVHFPITLILLAGFLEIAGRFKWLDVPRSLKLFVLGISALSGLVASGCGWLLSNPEEYQLATLDNHKWLGLLCTFSAIGAFFALRNQPQNPTSVISRLYAPLLSLGVISLMPAGHFGAQMTHGQNYLTEVLPWNHKKKAPRKPIDVPSDVLITFNDHIKPIFDEKCVSCHGAEKQKKGLRLDSEVAILKGSTEGLIVNIGHPQDSRLFTVVNLPRDSEEFMPKKGPAMTRQEISLLKRWISFGLQKTIKESDRIAMTPGGKGIGAKEENPKSHWAFQPLNKPKIPLNSHSRWSKNPIDRLYYTQYADAGVEPSPPASQEVLLRRAYFGLIGLPPSIEEQEAFLSQQGDEAYPQLIDQLLNRPEYGERWARHWLDVARYADTGGYELDSDRPSSYTYRDFVIKAFNQDMPFDQFVEWQLAGDEIEPGNLDALAATGFLTVGMLQNQSTKLLDRYDEWHDMLDTTSLAMLGLSVGCARCHDHKFDPISQKEYYQMLTAFQPSRREYKDLDGVAKKKGTFRGQKHQLEVKAFERYQQSLGVKEKAMQRASDLMADLYRNPASWNLLYRSRLANYASRKLDRQLMTEMNWNKITPYLNPDELKIYHNVKNGLAEESGRPPLLYLTDQSSKPPPSFLLKRGNPGTPGEEVSLGFLGVLSSEQAPMNRWFNPPKQATTTHMRRGLASWLTDSEMGAGHLLARVMVNRVWHHHFGEGLVATPNNFGLKGDPPKNRELLDFLAWSLIDNGWKIKPIQKMILVSEAYRQSTKRAPGSQGREVVRLEAEGIRDAILAISGSLNRQMFGPGVKPPIHPDAIDPAFPRWPKKVRAESKVWRRSIYVFQSRSTPYPMFQFFDAPDARGSRGKRMDTVTPLQALYMLNSDFIKQQSTIMAQKILGSKLQPEEQDIERAYLMTLVRKPTQAELEEDLAFIKQLMTHHEAKGPKEKIGLKAMGAFCQTLFNTSEFKYIN